MDARTNAWDSRRGDRPPCSAVTCVKESPGVQPPVVQRPLYACHGFARVGKLYVMVEIGLHKTAYIRVKIALRLDLAIRPCIY